MSSNARCQSCGMPLKVDPKGGGRLVHMSHRNGHGSAGFQPLTDLAQGTT